MMKIFAKHGTNEKVIIPAPQSATHDIILHLNKTYGGSWLWVDKLLPGEGLKFSDNTVYRGFSGKEERFTDALIKF